MLMTELCTGQTLTIDDTVIKMVKCSERKGGSVRLAIDAHESVKISFEKQDANHKNKTARGISK